MGLLKCPKGRLEDEWQGRFHSPRYSRKLTFWHCRLCPLFALDLILCVLAAVKPERQGVHLWPELYNFEVNGKKLTLSPRGFFKVPCGHIKALPGHLKGPLATLK